MTRGRHKSTGLPIVCKIRYQLCITASGLMSAGTRFASSSPANDEHGVKTLGT